MLRWLLARWLYFLTFCYAVLLDKLDTSCPLSSLRADVVSRSLFSLYDASLEAVITRDGAMSDGQPYSGRALYVTLCPSWELRELSEVCQSRLVPHVDERPAQHAVTRLEAAARSHRVSLSLLVPWSSCAQHAPCAPPCGYYQLYASL